MARTAHKLTALDVKNMKKPGKHGDGAGLYLRIQPGGVARGWVFRFRNREHGLGSWPTISLADARRRAADCRRLLSEGLDPIAEGRRTRDAAKPIPPHATFASAAETYIAAKAGEWRAEKTLKRWRRLAGYASDALGPMAIASIDTNDVLRVLKPYWGAKPETGAKLRECIESVLDAATASGLRPPSSNPARWKGNLEHLLPSHAKIAKPSHRRALPWADAPALYAEMSRIDTPAARAHRLLVLTACRSAEALQARWAEFTPDFRVWTIPATRTKSGRPLRIPQNGETRELLLQQMEFSRGNGYVFPGRDANRPLCESTLIEIGTRHGWAARFTPHGWRSTFRCWAADATDFPREVAEAALGHVIGDASEIAYQRSDLLERRRPLMLAWEHFLLNC